ncbi:hypothetical protein BLA29_010530 [Euroglyphus maynei]|uniref:G-protein coupled receptors family 1 profile domain-containing protein n=1 Tax=Euroglyphus maynei TaxID=6958 RepID=A0A1Y3BA88_EURMA|nr:hypothetical protein BLA29_010530 [Euroglyphus maynei]
MLLVRNLHSYHRIMNFVLVVPVILDSVVFIVMRRLMNVIVIPVQKIKNAFQYHQH